LNDTVGEHFGVHAEILDAALFEQRADRVRHGADADLDAVAVLDLADDPLGDRAVGVAWGRIAQLRRRQIVTVDDVVDLADMHGVAVAIDVGQAGADLDDDGFGALYHGAMPDIGRPEIEPARFVHGTGLEDNDVDRIDEAPVVIGHLAEVERNVVAAAGV